jgi:hypothetical protein
MELENGSVYMLTPLVSTTELRIELAVPIRERL